MNNSISFILAILILSSCSTLKLKKDDMFLTKTPIVFEYSIDTAFLGVRKHRYRYIIAASEIKRNDTLDIFINKIEYEIPVISDGYYLTWIKGANKKITKIRFDFEEYKISGEFIWDNRYSVMRFYVCKTDSEFFSEEYYILIQYTNTIYMD